MIVWVLWEDQRAPSRDFGPHRLLLSCLADDVEERLEHWLLDKLVRPIPKKGNSSVLKALKEDLEKLQGLTCAVFDRDKAHLLWGKAHEPARCRTAILAKIKGDASGEYEVILLEDNVETLFDVCQQVLGEAPRKKGEKPSRDERDACLRRAAGRPEARRKVRHEVPSFDRLVKRVGRLLESAPR